MHRIVLAAAALVALTVIGCKTSVPVQTEGEISLRRAGNGVEGMEVLTMRFLPSDNRLMFIDSILVDQVNVPFGRSDATTTYTLTSVVMLGEYDENADLVPHSKYGVFRRKRHLDAVIYPEDNTPIIFTHVRVQTD